MEFRSRFFDEGPDIARAALEPQVRSVDMKGDVAGIFEPRGLSGAFSRKVLVWQDGEQMQIMQACTLNVMRLLMEQKWRDFEFWKNGWLAFNFGTMNATSICADLQQSLSHGSERDVAVQCCGGTSGSRYLSQFYELHRKTNKLPPPSQ